MGATRFVEHRSERLHLLVRGIDHPPLELGSAPARQIEAGLYVTVLVEGRLRICCGRHISTPRRHGMQVLQAIAGAGSVLTNSSYMGISLA